MYDKSTLMNTGERNFPSYPAMEQVGQACRLQLWPVVYLPSKALGMLEPAERSLLYSYKYRYGACFLEPVDFDGEPDVLHLVALPLRKWGESEERGRRTLRALQALGLKVDWHVYALCYELNSMSCVGITEHHSCGPHIARGATKLTASSRWNDKVYYVHQDNLRGVEAAIEATLEDRVISAHMNDGAICGVQRLGTWLLEGAEDAVARQLEEGREGFLVLEEQDKLLSLERVAELTGIPLDSVPAPEQRPALIKLPSMQHALEVAWQALHPEVREVLDFCYSQRGLVAPITLSGKPPQKCLNYYFLPAGGEHKGLSLHEEPTYFREPGEVDVFTMVGDEDSVGTSEPSVSIEP